MMKNEFYEAYCQIFENSFNHLRRTIRIKLKAIRYTTQYILPNIESQQQAVADAPVSKKKRNHTSYKGDLIDHITEEKKQDLPQSGFEFKPIEQREVDEESSLFYSTDSEEEIDNNEIR